MCFFVSFQKWTVIVDTAGHINYSNDKCPWWTVIVEKSTIVVQWTVIVAAATAATISVHGGQLSLMDSYRCYNGPSFMTKFCSVLYLENLLRNIFAKLNLRGGVSCMPAALLLSFELEFSTNFDSLNISEQLKFLEH